MTIAEQFDKEYYTCSNSTRVRNAIERIEARLFALETWQSNHSPVMTSPFSDDNPQDAKPQGREWIEPVDVMFWCLWDDGEITVEDVLGLCVWENDKNLVKIMPYIEGEPKPDAPKGEK